MTQPVLDLNGFGLGWVGFCPYKIDLGWSGRFEQKLARLDPFVPQPNID